RIRMRSRNVGVRIAGSNVDRLPLWINRRSRPDRASSGSVHLSAGRVLLERLWLVLNRVALPQDLAGAGIERDKAAAKLATLVLRIAPGGLFKRRHRRVDSAFKQNRRAGYA